LGLSGATLSTRHQRFAHKRRTHHWLRQLQIEFRKTFPQLLLELLHIIPELKAPHEVISETHQVCLATTLCFEFLLEPQVERKVQVDITEHRRYRATLRRPFLGGNNGSVS
jgi:hypothetical protein